MSLVHRQPGDEHIEQLYNDGKSYDAISCLTGLPIGTINNRIAGMIQRGEVNRRSRPRLVDPESGDVTFGEALRYQRIHGVTLKIKRLRRAKTISNAPSSDHIK